MIRLIRLEMLYLAGETLGGFSLYFASSQSSFISTFWLCSGKPINLFSFSRSVRKRNWSTLQGSLADLGIKYIIKRYWASHYMVFHLYLHDLRWLCDFSSMCFHFGIRKRLFFLLCWILKEGNKKANVFKIYHVFLFYLWKLEVFASIPFLHSPPNHVSYCPDLWSGRNQDWVNFSNSFKATQLVKGIARWTWILLMAKPWVFPTFHAHILLSLGRTPG